MWPIIFRRLSQLVVGIIGASLIVFTAARASGDPVYLLLPEDSSPLMIAEYRARLRLDQPLLTQYLDFVLGFVRGDLGWSFRQNAPVATLILERLPNTLVLAATSLVLALSISIPLGVLAAARYGSLVDQTIQMVGMVGQAMPVYWSGLLLIIFVAVPTGWFPTGGGGSLRHMILPSLTLSSFLMARIVRLTRSG